MSRTRLQMVSGRTLSSSAMAICGRARRWVEGEARRRSARGEDGTTARARGRSAAAGARACFPLLVAERHQGVDQGVPLAGVQPVRERGTARPGQAPGRGWSKGSGAPRPGRISFGWRVKFHSPCQLWRVGGKASLCPSLLRTPVWQALVPGPACTRSPARVVAAMVCTMTWWLVTGRPRQFTGHRRRGQPEPALRLPRHGGVRRAGRQHAAGRLVA
jgi:hypothetical protein